MCWSSPGRIPGLDKGIDACWHGAETVYGQGLGCGGVLARLVFGLPQGPGHGVLCVFEMKDREDGSAFSVSVLWDEDRERVYVQGGDVTLGGRVGAVCREWIGPGRGGRGEAG